MGSSAPLHRIGELSRRVGVSTERLRAWERRYQLLTPVRTEGGFRLYDAADERRVRRMLELLDQGISASEAARLARDEPEPAGTSAPAGSTTPHELAAQLGAALDSYDEAGAHAALDRLLAAFSVETALREGVLPYLHEFGERWQRGEATIGQEHFASALLRGRLLGLARGWGNGGSPGALLACAPGDQHDLGLICFGLTLRAHGWRITFLGPDTPLRTVAETIAQVEPALVVLTAATAGPFEGLDEELTALARTTALALAGPGIEPEAAGRVGAVYLADDPVTAAAAIAER